MTWPLKCEIECVNRTFQTISTLIQTNQHTLSGTLKEVKKKPKNTIWMSTIFSSIKYKQITTT